MRRGLYFFFILCISQVTVLAQEAWVTIKYVDEQVDEEHSFITPLEDGTYCFAKLFKVFPDMGGYTRLKIKLSQPGFIYTSVGYPIAIYLEPNADVFVDFGKAIPFKGGLRKENTFIYQSKFAPGGYPRLFEEFTTADAFRDFLRQQIQRHQEVIKGIAELERKLPRELVKYAGTSHLISMLNLANRIVGSKVDKARSENTLAEPGLQWQTLRAELFPDSLIYCNLTKSGEYAEYLLAYGEYLKDKKVIDSPIEKDIVLPDKDSFTLDQRLSGVTRETYMVEYISKHVLSGPAAYNSFLVDYFAKFRKEFPNSLAIPVLEPEIKKVVRFLAPR